jgi:hypothetical protein
MVAIISYLQRLGRGPQFQPATTPEAPVAPVSVEGGP